MLRSLPFPPRVAVLTLAAIATGGLAAVLVLQTVRLVGDAGAGAGARWVSPACMAACAALLALRAATIRRERTAWAALAAGVLLALAGDTISSWTAPTGPGVCDALWLAAYPALYLGLGLLARQRVVGTPAAFWLDGLAAALATAALALLALAPALRGMGAHPTLAVALDLTSAVADVTLLGVVVGVIALRGRPDRPLLLLSASLTVLALADGGWTVLSAFGLYHDGSRMDPAWPAAYVLMAAAAWARPGGASVHYSRGWWELAVPGALLALATAVLLVDDHVDAPPEVDGLAAAALAVVAVRTALAIREAQALGQAHAEARTDVLTGLPNRRALLRALETAVVAAAAPGAAATVLLLVDLDDFKEVNDGLGHAAGDDLLRRVGPRMQGVLRPDDLLARLGGDEFAVLAPSLDVADGLRLAERLRAAIGRPVEVGEHDLRPEASVGVAVLAHGDPGLDATELLRRADLAMYRAKRSRAGQAAYSPDDDRPAAARLQAPATARAVFARDELVLHYQPQVHLPDGELRCAEALVRWRHPERGLLGPAELLPILAQARLMHRLTLRVLDLALDQIAAWTAQGRRIPVAVNVSAGSLREPTLAADIVAAVQRRGVDPALLIVEVTEDAVVADLAAATVQLQALSRAGVRVALDDFGTGHASLAHLRHLPVHELKVDRGFTRHLAADVRDQAIVRHVVELGHSLGLVVVVEGVEDARTLGRVTALGADAAQGYLLARPLPAEELVRWISARAAAAREPQATPPQA